MPNQLPNFPPPPQLVLPVDNAKYCKEFQYAVKVLCGPIHSPILSDARYLTVVNIHNPSPCKHVTFRWKVAVARQLPTGSPGRDLAGVPVGGPVSRFQRVTLRPDEAIEINCSNIQEFAKDAGNVLEYVKGFVIIETPCELDVVSVYTALTASPNQPSDFAFHTERVPARTVCACTGDIQKNLSTGVANWTLIVAPAPITVPRPASIIAPIDNGGGWATQGGSLWVGVTGNGKTVQPGGQVEGSNVYVYQTCFTLCAAFGSPTISGTVLADDKVEMWVNDTFVALSFQNPGNHYSAPSNSITGIPPSAFRPGLNCVRFVVWNRQPSPEPTGPTGLNVLATLSATNAGCPPHGCCND